MILDMFLIGGGGVFEKTLPPNQKDPFPEDMWETEQGPEKNQKGELREGGEGGSGSSVAMDPDAGFWQIHYTSPAMKASPSVKLGRWVLISGFCQI